MPRDVASRAIKREVDAGRGVGPLKNGVYLDFAESIERLGHDVIEERYGNLFEMYERITDEDPYRVPMRIYPAVHYTMGGLWVDYNLMSNVPGLFVLGEANFSDHGANRLGASALMQGLADGYFVLPYTIGDYLAPLLGDAAGADRRPRVPARPRADVDDQVRQAAVGQRQRTVDDIHRELGKILWDNCGMARSERASRRRSPRSPRSARSSGRTCACSARTRRSTSRSRRPGASPTSSSSASCCASTRCTARSRAAATSARSTRPRTARRSATTSTSRYVAAWEFTGVGTDADAPQGAARVRVRPPRDQRSYK